MAGTRDAFCRLVPALDPAMVAATSLTMEMMPSCVGQPTQNRLWKFLRRFYNALFALGCHF